MLREYTLEYLATLGLTEKINPQIFMYTVQKRLNLSLNKLEHVRLYFNCRKILMMLIELLDISDMKYFLMG